MRYLFFLVCLALPGIAFAQAPKTPQSAFAAALAENLSNALEQVGSLSQRVSDLQKELEEAKKSCVKPTEKPPSGVPGVSTENAHPQTGASQQ